MAEGKSKSLQGTPTHDMLTVMVPVATDTQVHREEKEQAAAGRGNKEGTGLPSQGECAVAYRFSDLAGQTKQPTSLFISKMQKRRGLRLWGNN